MLRYGLNFLPLANQWPCDDYQKRNAQKKRVHRYKKNRRLRNWLSIAGYSMVGFRALSKMNIRSHSWDDCFPLEIEESKHWNGNSIL